MDNRTITIVPVQFYRRDMPGDYLWHIRQVDDQSEKTIYLFNDNTSRSGTGGSAAIRYIDGIRKVGICTIHNWKAYQSIEEARRQVDQDLSMLMEEINQVRTDVRIFIPVGPDGRTLGCGTFDVPREVLEYITQAIYATVIWCSPNREVPIRFDRKFLNKDYPYK